MLGQGNDTFQILGTLDPDDAVKLIGSIVLTPSPAPAGIRATLDVTRSQPFDWKSQGFLVGQPVHISGFGGQVWKVVGFSDDVRRRHDRQHGHAPRARHAMTHAALDAAASRPRPLDRRRRDDERQRLRRHADPRGRQLDRRRLRGRPAGHDRRASPATWRVLAVTNAGKTLVLGDGPALASSGRGHEDRDTASRRCCTTTTPTTCRSR